MIGTILFQRAARAILCATLSGTLAGQTSTDVEQRIQRIRAAVNLTERMAALHVPGVSIAMIHGGRIEWARGLGVLRVGGGPVTPDSLFQAASISKPVSAMAVLHLVESGKLALDRDVNEYLKTWKVPANAFTDRKKVTLRGLLTHTAGLTVHGFAGYATGEPVPTLLQVLNGEAPANSAPIRVDVEPGTIWRYSGGGYVVAQQLVQDVIATPFPKFMRDTVLGPIGMTRSTFEQPLPAGRMAEVALPYRADGTLVAGGPHVYPEMTAAGLWTTPSDLARYAIEIQRVLAGGSPHVLTAGMLRQMLTPGMNRQGLGPGTGGSEKRPYFSHSGGNEGYRCNLLAYNEGDGLVIMTNSDNGAQLWTEIQRAVAREYGWPDFQPK